MRLPRHRFTAIGLALLALVPAQRLVLASATPIVQGLGVQTAGIAGGGTLTIRGASFSGATSVAFGTTLVSSGVAVTNDTTVTVPIPAHPSGTVDVTVTNSSGVSPGTNDDLFTFIQPAPAIDHLSRDSGPSGTTITIFGTALAGPSYQPAGILFGSARSTQAMVHADGSVAVTAPPGTGTVSVRVSTQSDDGTVSVSSNGVPYTYVGTPLPPPTPGPSNATLRYMGRIYRDVLGREPDSAGAQWWATQLDSGAYSRSSASMTVLDSDEYRGKQITAFYQLVFNRAPDPGGLQFYIGWLRSGHSYEELDAGLLGSDEFFANAGGTNRAFVDAAYLIVFKRHADQGGLDFWAGALDAGKPRWVLGQQLAYSDERLAALVTNAYSTLLGRSPDADGLTYWSGYLRGGGSDDRFLAGMMASPEYFNRAQSTS